MHFFLSAIRSIDLIPVGGARKRFGRMPAAEKISNTAIPYLVQYSVTDCSDRPERGPFAKVQYAQIAFAAEAISCEAIGLLQS